MSTAEFAANQQTDGPLAGYRALDLTDEKGRLCSRILADMGAEVIRVEKPAPGPPEGNSSWEDLGKRSVTLNIETEAGQEIFNRLSRTADILVESYPPGHLESLGLDYSSLGQLNPGLIMASITGFGQDGPHRDYKSSDLATSALGGQMYVCGEPDMPPLKPFGNQAYYCACLFAATGILLALWHRHTTGRGQHIDISIQECVAATLDHVLVRYFYEGVTARRQGSRHWNSAFRIFPCRDGHILFSLFQHWQTLVEWLDAEGMAEDLTDKKWGDGEYRLGHTDHIVEVLGRWAQTHTAAELVEKGQLMRFPWAKVTSIPELVDSPQLKERGFFIEARHPKTGRKYKYPAAPCKLSRSPWRTGGRAPNPGEHNIGRIPW
ncbi:MAG: CoA transferase [Chloroflexi bacterium]|nr:CoA transferase [Chloroflexota bacterium]